MITPAAAGEGIPKSLLCSLIFSILKRASLKAAQTIKNRLKIQPSLPS